MSQQLRFEGDPNFAERSFHIMIKESFLVPIREYMNYGGFVMSIPAVQGVKEVKQQFLTQQLFTPTVECKSYFAMDESYIECNLDAGHNGPHYDAHLRVEWSQR